MANVRVKSVEILDHTHTILPYEGYHRYRFSIKPYPIGHSEQLYFKITCSVFPHVSQDVKFKAQLLSPDYLFIPGRNSAIGYQNPNVQNAVSFEWPFEISNIIDAVLCTVATIKISHDNDPTDSYIIELKIG